MQHIFGIKNLFLCCDTNTFVYVQHFLYIIFHKPYTTHSSFVSILKQVNMREAAMPQAELLSMYCPCIIILQLYHQNYYNSVSYKYYSSTNGLFHNTTRNSNCNIWNECAPIQCCCIYKLCLNYEAQETYPNTPWLGQLVTEDYSCILQNLLTLAYSGVPTKTYECLNIFGEGLTHKNMKLRRVVAELWMSYCVGHSRQHF